MGFRSLGFEGVELHCSNLRFKGGLGGYFDFGQKVLPIPHNPSYELQSPYSSLDLLNQERLHVAFHFLGFSVWGLAMQRAWA